MRDGSVHTEVSTVVGELLGKPFPVRTEIKMVLTFHPPRPTPPPTAAMARSARQRRDGGFIARDRQRYRDR